MILAEIPLMTEEGTFLVNGCERIVISQIIRSPGVYFRKEYLTNRKTIYTATIISNKGPWTKFILDQSQSNQKDVLYFKSNDFRTKNSEPKEKDIESDNSTIFIYDLIRYFGLSIEEYP